MLTSFDDYFIHQTPHPVTVPSTSDRHAYDRYWFNGYTSDGSLFFGIGAARYPNLGVQDCGFSVIHDGVQHCFHHERRQFADIVWGGAQNGRQCFRDRQVLLL